MGGVIIFSTVESKQSHFDVLEGTIVVNPEMRHVFLHPLAFLEVNGV